jgi:hypothetical protein
MVKALKYVKDAWINSGSGFIGGGKCSDLNNTYTEN